MEKSFGRNGELIGIAHSQHSAGQFKLGQWVSPASAPPIEPHGHSAAHIVIVTAGAFRTEAEGPDRGPMIIFNPAGTYHGDQFERGGAFVGVTLSPRASTLVHELPLPRNPSRMAGSTAAGIAASLMRAANAAGENCEDDSLEALCFELVGEVERPAKVDRNAPRWLSVAAEMLRDHRGGTGVEAVAEEVKVHPVHLTRTFRRHYRCTPGEYRRLHKVSEAAKLLLQPRLSIAHVAADCAFADQSHLVRSFKRHFGMTPQQFRHAVA